MKNITTYLLTVVFVLMTGPVWAGSVTIPNTFTSGTKAIAADVNANFNAVKSAVDDNDTRLSNVESNTVSKTNPTWNARTGYISVSAAAAQPIMNGYSYYKNWGYIQNSGSSTEFFFVPLQLPHNATVTKLTVYWYDASAAADMTVTLRRVDHINQYYIMAPSLGSTGSAGYNSSFTSSISQAVINNTLYSYILYIILPDPDTRFAGALIEYTTTGPN